MKSTLICLIALFSLNVLALSQTTKDHLKKIDENRRSFMSTSYLIDISLKEYLSETISKVWGDEVLEGFCFGVKPQEFGRAASDLRGMVEFDRYPVSWRQMSRKFSDMIYKESRNDLDLNLREASQAAFNFRNDVKGSYFKGCELEWIGSFGGGSSSFYISENGSIKFGRITSWSE